MKVPPPRTIMGGGQQKIGALHRFLWAPSIYTSDATDEYGIMG